MLSNGLPLAFHWPSYPFHWPSSAQAYITGLESYVPVSVRSQLVNCKGILHFVSLPLILQIRTLNYSNSPFTSQITDKVKFCTLCNNLTVKIIVAVQYFMASSVRS